LRIFDGRQHALIVMHSFAIFMFSFCCKRFIFLSFAQNRRLDDMFVTFSSSANFHTSWSLLKLYTQKCGVTLNLLGTCCINLKTKLLKHVAKLECPAICLRNNTLISHFALQLTKRNIINTVKLHEHKIPVTVKEKNGGFLAKAYFLCRTSKVDWFMCHIAKIQY